MPSFRKQVQKSLLTRRTSPVGIAISPTPKSAVPFSSDWNRHRFALARVQTPSAVFGRELLAESADPNCVRALVDRTHLRCVGARAQNRYQNCDS